MREIRTSGSTRGEWAALCVAPSPTLPARFGSTLAAARPDTMNLLWESSLKLPLGRFSSGGRHSWNGFPIPTLGRRLSR
jgi:hypothetical protein